MSNWDPLDIAGSASSDIVAAARKREIRNILKSYVGFYDPFCELIQNALDAVDVRARLKPDESYSRKLWITIDLQKNQLTVTDNGVGFSEGQFRTFLSPSMSFKNTKDTRGNKGVGATYLAFGFNYMLMGTKTSTFSTFAEIVNGREWVDDDAATVSQPLVKSLEDVPSTLDDLDTGSTFTLGFSGNVRPKDLGWTGASDASQWKTLMLIRTPLGQIIRREDKSACRFDLKVIDKMGVSTSVLDQDCVYVFPHNVIKATVRVTDILAEQQRLLSLGKDSSKLPVKFKKLNAVWDEYPPDQLKLLSLSENEKALIDTHEVWAYGFFCYSAPRVFDYYNDSVARLRKNMRILRGGLQLATSAMPQGDLITIPLTSNIGYQHQAHVVVHLRDADPDLGRKGFQPELTKLAERISAGLVNRLKQWRHLLLSDSGPGGTHQEDLNLDDWINAQREHEKAHPIVLTNKNFFVPLNEIAITAEPSSEQDVVSLFNQLIAGGVIRGIRLMAASSHQQYDGLFRYHLRPPIANHLYASGTNPLGIENQQNKEGFASKPYVLEFKHTFDALMVDFDNEEKTEASINLAVVWELGTRFAERYQLVSLLTDENRHLRQFHGVTHELHDDHTGDKRMDLVILSDLFRFLNGEEEEGKRQAALYGHSGEE